MLPLLALYDFVLGLMTPSAVNCQTPGSCPLFDYAAGLAAFLFVMVTVLIFVFVYDNLRRGRKTTATIT
ncbi:MAG TPA: hypothetical protein VFF30_00565 [Nitrososphaerales archaeon]|nr:hypothetical protein [Nitrososphaerales archaeon]